MYNPVIDHTNMKTPCRFVYTCKQKMKQMISGYQGGSVQSGRVTLRREVDMPKVSNLPVRKLVF